MPADGLLTAGTLTVFLLVLTRLGFALVFVPIPGLNGAPQTARAVLVLSLTLASFPAWPTWSGPLPHMGQMLVWIASEATLGTAIGLTIAFLAESFMLATQVIGLQAGYSYASTVDPNSQADSSVLAILAQLVGNLLFFAMGADRIVLKAMARSLEVCPLGQFGVSLASATAVIHLGGSMLELGVRLALPIAGLLILIDLTLALLGRIHAQLQLLSLSFPIKMLGALCLLAAMAPIFPVVYGMGASRSWATLAKILER